jgi:hypothetical protein
MMRVVRTEAIDAAQFTDPLHPFNPLNPFLNRYGRPERQFGWSPPSKPKRYWIRMERILRIERMKPELR